MAYDTAANIINHAAAECGLATVADPYASTDQNFVQLRYLLTSLGQDLWRERQWTHLLHARAFKTVLNTPSYALPADFGAMVNQTGWNRTNRLPLGGPLSPQEWQFLKARLVGVVFTVLFRPMQGQLYLYPDTNTPGGYVLAFEYLSRYWTQAATTAATIADQIDQGFWRGDWLPSTAYNADEYVLAGGRIYTTGGGGTSGSLGPTGTGGSITDGTITWEYNSEYGAESVQATSDLILFDPQLVRRGLKLAFLKAKGFDSTSAQNDYDKTLEQVLGDDSAAPVLRLGQANGWQEPLLSDANVPITGFGS